MATDLESLKDSLAAKKALPAVPVGLDSVAGFEALQRVANLFSASNIVPTQYQGNLPNCVIAVDMALRMGANPLMVCQNLYVVHGRPAWSAQFLIATLNQSGKFSALRYKFQGQAGNDDWGCRAIATEKSTGETLEGPLVTIALAKKEGWYGKPGSKWQSMPELMLRYRSASWFVRAYAPEIAMGLQTAEEVADTYDLEQTKDGVFATSDTVTTTAENVEKSETHKRRGRKPKPEQDNQTEQNETPVEMEAGHQQEQPESTQENELIRCPNGPGDLVYKNTCADCRDFGDCSQWKDSQK